MTRIYSTLTIILLVSINVLTAGIIEPAKLTFDFNACISEAVNGTNTDYSEFTAAPANNGAVRLSAAGGHLYRARPLTNPHSCTEGLNGTNAMCIAVNPLCDYIPGSPEAVRFDILVEPLVGSTIRIEELNFQQKAPEIFSWINGGTNVNNYPTLYGIRIHANSQLLYEEHDIPTTRDWSLETLNFNGNSNFLVVAPTVFSFELLPYCSVGILGPATIWDLEDISITANCVNDCAEAVFNSTVSLEDGTNTYYGCVGDTEFPVLNSSSLDPSNYDYLITDANYNVLKVLQSNMSVNLDEYAAGTYFVYGYAGDGTGLVGSNISFIPDVDCQGVSSNSVTVLINQPYGGILSGGPFEFCHDNQSAIFIPQDAISLSGNIGGNSQWVITDATGINIVATPAHPSQIDFSSVPSGTCLIYHISFDGWIKGLEIGGLMTNLESGSLISSTCYDLSNPITVIKNEPSNVTLSGGPFDFCSGDGQADIIPAGQIAITGTMGVNNQWVVTDPNGLITNVATGSYDGINFESMPGATCYLTLVNYMDTLGGLMIGNSLYDLGGCLNLSNQITVNKNNCAQLNGGTVDGGPLSFCTSDGQADLLSNLTITGNNGSINQWVITTETGVITELVPALNMKNFEGSPAGVCLAWHLTYETGLMGLAVGNTISSDLQGMFGLSNSIMITKSQVTAGTISGGPYLFCVGDGEEDRVPQGEVMLTGNTGTQGAWIAVEEGGTTILAIADTANGIDFENTGAADVLLHHISYQDSLTGLVAGAEIAELEGCLGVSNGIIVRKTYVNGGELIGGLGYFQFCVGDTIPDYIPDGALELIGNAGSSQSWVITNESGTEILDLPASPYEVDFNSSLPGTCVLWSVSATGPITGLEVGADFLALEGCLSKSSFISIFRYQNTPGILTGGPFEFCVHDATPDIIQDGTIEVTGNTGANNQWIVTDDNGIIRYLPIDSYNELDFDVLDAGIFYIYLLSYDGLIDGLGYDQSLLSLDGCFSLSNRIRIVSGVCQQPNPTIAMIEVNTSGLVELMNVSENSISLDNYWFVSNDIHSEITKLQVICGEGYELMEGESLFVELDFDLSSKGDELALMYEDEISHYMSHYVIWGSHTGGMTEMAIDDEMWTEGDMVEAIPKDMVLVYDGEGYHSSDWAMNSTMGCELKASNNLDIATNINVSVFPNPVKGLLTVQIESSDVGEAQVEIISRLGQVLVNSKISRKNNTIDLEYLEAGMYFLRVTHNGNSTTQAIVKN